MKRSNNPKNQGRNGQTMKNIVTPLNVTTKRLLPLMLPLMLPRNSLYYMELSLICNIITFIIYREYKQTDRLSIYIIYACVRARIRIYCCNVTLFGVNSLQHKELRSNIRLFSDCYRNIALFEGLGGINA